MGIVLIHINRNRADQNEEVHRKRLTHRSPMQARDMKGALAAKTAGRKNAMHVMRCGDLLKQAKRVQKVMENEDQIEAKADHSTVRQDDKVNVHRFGLSERRAVVSGNADDR